MSDGAGGDRKLSRKEAAEFLSRLGLKVSSQTLAIRATRKNMEDEDRKGPPFFKTMSRVVHYLESDLRKWAQDNTRRIE